MLALPVLAFCMWNGDAVFENLRWMILHPYTLSLLCFRYKLWLSCRQRERERGGERGGSTPLTTVTHPTHTVPHCRPTAPPGGKAACRGAHALETGQWVACSVLLLSPVLRRVGASAHLLDVDVRCLTPRRSQQVNTIPIKHTRRLLYWRAGTSANLSVSIRPLILAFQHHSCTLCWPF